MKNSLMDIFKAIAVSLPVLATHAHAEGFTGEQIRGMFFEPKGEVEYPACIYQGEEVEYREGTLDVMLHGRGNAVAFAAQDNGVPYIMLNKELIASVDPVFRNFVLRHECKHHQNGHIEHFSREHYDENEDDADCTAIKEMRDEGLTLQDLSIIEEFNVALVQAFYPANAKRDDAQIRNAHIRRCYQTDAEDLSY